MRNIKFSSISNIIPRIIKFDQTRVHYGILYSSIIQRRFSNTNVSGLEYFDTNSFVERLEREGFTRQQSEAIMNSLSDVINNSLQSVTSEYVTKSDTDKSIYTAKVDISKLKSELQVVERSDFNMLKIENERLLTEIDKLKQKLNEEIKKTQGGVKLDINLEKGRIREETSSLELELTKTGTRIESEIAALRTQMETIKAQILQYMIGTLTGVGALILAYMRMFR
ncbi:hypothetical protein RclHR1_05130014 [Rhizophagus clarus]|uniref:Mitochondrial protein n=1 Tax=Rhizophagus clarus TaxID=94130 RepID=A0A2Z6S474_9GLOM|nr:hypothetical protein RclHR1_05130014 [Rhizophagus clarus]GES81343.1 mitochondrial protein [Rhizophagus clarus]